MSDVKEAKPMSYADCSAALLQMWIDNILSDAEYYRLIAKLNKKHELEDN